MNLLQNSFVKHFTRINAITLKCPPICLNPIEFIIIFPQQFLK